MFPRVCMKTLLTIALLIAAINAPVLAQRKTTIRKTAARPTVLRLLKTVEPGIKWNAKSLLTGDFDYDNVSDYALTGKKGDSFVLGIVKGRLSQKSRYWALEFSVGDGLEDSLCSAASAAISLETFAPDDELEELRKLPKTSRGINLADGLCDAFRIYYLQSGQRFVWRRN